MNNYKNYKFILNESLDDIKSEGYFFEHKSGAKLIYIDNDDENRVFSVCFKTMPKDNTGAAHIMEHCVLCGSENFRLKDPFNELDKGSLNTYLNALTFSDKTLFPIASTNEKEFYKLMNVYLDAVFFPLIYERKGIFLQEGWHKTKNGINGVVYNEMLGALSDPEELLELKITQKLFKDTDYRYCSAGMPEDIPKLSYESFLDFHKKYYHPSNSIIYLYGKNDMKKCLDFIDGFLSKFEFKPIKTEYKHQEPFYEPQTIEICYDGEENIIEVGFASFFSYDFVKSEAINVLCSALFNSEASPIRQALLNSGICEDVQAYTDEDMYMGVLFIKFCGVKCENAEVLREALTKALNDVYSKGINKKLLDGCILNEKFYFSEADFGHKPKGLFYNLRILQSFAYGKENFDGLKFSSIFEKIEKIDYISLLKESVADNKHCVYAVLKKGETSQKSENFDFIEYNENEFLDYQNIEDDKYNIRKISPIMLSDIDPNPIKLESSVLDNGGIIFNTIKNDEIIYVNFALDTSCIPFELKKYIGIYIYLLGKMNTLNYSYEELNNDINYYFGGFDIYSSLYNLKESGSFLPVVNFSVKAFKNNGDKIFSVIKEIIFESDFFDLNRMKLLLRELKSRIEESFYTDGSFFAGLRCCSYFDISSRYEENIKGMEFYWFLCDILSQESFEETAQCLLSLKNCLLKKDNIFLSFSSALNEEKNILNNYKAFCGCFCDEEVKNKYLCINENKYLNEAFILKSSVNYNIMAADYFKSGIKYNGKLIPINKIIASDYLWNKVRAENGAYGSNLSIKRNGIMLFSSYRDPKLENTFIIYERAFDYLSRLKLEKTELNKYIIGTINILDKPIKDNMINEIAMFRYFLGISYEQLKKEREEVLSFKNEDIKELSVVLNEALSKNFVCSLAQKDNIKTAENRFCRIKSLF